MKVGLAFAASIAWERENSLELIKTAETAGFESVWCGEHVILPDTIISKYPYTEDGKIPATADTAIPDPLIWLAFAAAASSTLRLGTCILIVPQRNPLVLAKELATLDRISGGRVELGLGVGWLKEEFDALGVPWEARGARNDEYVAAMRALWREPHVEFHGKYVDFDKVTCSPRPVKGSIPVIVGGDTDAALRRAARHADGYFPGEGDPKKLAELIGRLHAEAEKIGRDPAEIKINIMFGAQMADPAAGIAELKALGVDRIMVPAFFFAGEDGLERLQKFGETIIPMAGD